MFIKNKLIIRVLQKNTSIKFKTELQNVGDMTFSILENGKHRIFTNFN